MIKLFLFTTAFLTYEYASAQKIPVDQQKSITVDNEQNRVAIGQPTVSHQKALAGTYQVILTNENHQFALNDAFLVWIETTRKQTEDQFISVNEHITLFLPSKNTIQQENFKALQEVTVKEN